MQCPSWISNDTGRPPTDAQYTSIWDSKFAPLCLLGSNGPTGPDGDAGPVGHTGVQGPKGKLGGPTGPTGLQGFVGTIGLTGMRGTPGRIGPVGLDGNGGVTGPTGLRGATGPVGTIGPTGNEGQTGTHFGPPGSPGVQGQTGPTGTIGPNDVGYVTQPFSTWFWQDEPVTINNISGVITLAQTFQPGPYLYVWFFDVFNTYVTPDSVILISLLNSNHDVILLPTLHNVSMGVFTVQVGLFYNTVELADIHQIHFKIIN